MKKNKNDIVVPFNSSFARWADAYPDAAKKVSESQKRVDPNSQGAAYLNTIGCAYKAEQPAVPIIPGINS